MDFGLIGSLVREHGLGLAVDTTCAAALAGAIARMAEQSVETFFDRDTARRFVGDHTPRHFAETVLASLASA